MRPITTPKLARPEVERRPAAGRRAAAGSLYRVLWRWHFYAGLLVTPVLLIVTITGALYIFRAEIEDRVDARLRLVEPGPARVGAQALVDAACGALPGRSPTDLELPSDPARAAIVRFGDRSGGGATRVHVDPYRGRVLGVVGPGRGGGAEAFFDATLRLHRELFLGLPGRLVVELTVGWTVILLVTGLYLWWPVGGRRAAGVWYPRLRGARLYTVLRDLHTVPGVYLLAPMALIVVTGLFYSPIWGEAFHRATGGGDPPAARPATERGGDRAGAHAGPSLPLDRIVAVARGRYPDRNLFITLAGPSDRTVKVAAANDYNSTYGPYVSARFEVDRRDGRMSAHSTLAEDARYWWHGWVYPLHVGSVLGPTTKVLWLVACLILIGLPVTGAWMWWERRPRGRSGFPRRPDRRLPPALIASIVALAILLPAVGASILLILAGEGIARMRLGSRS